jgi:hypothetical protein
VSDYDYGIMEAVDAAQFEVGGLTYSVVPGQPGTTFTADHPVVRAHPHLFKPFRPNYETGAPRSEVRADQRGARSR